jgi:predicted protein tyrosine phosphatase
MRRLHWLARELTLELADRETPDVTWIAPDLAIGGRVLSDEWPRLAKAGVHAVVDCRLEASDPADLLTRLGISFLHLPTPDSGNFTPRQVTDGVAWIERQWADGRRVLVHCQAGKGRSVLIGGAALTTRGMTPDEALALIRARRPIVTPTPGQISRLRAFAVGYQLPLPLGEE